MGVLSRSVRSPKWLLPIPFLLGPGCGGDEWYDISSVCPAPEGVIKHDARPPALEVSTSSCKGNSWRLDSTVRSF